jgi:hypothetical protein
MTKVQRLWPACLTAEGAIQVIDGKARFIAENLAMAGACSASAPRGDHDRGATRRLLTRRSSSSTSKPSAALQARHAAAHEGRGSPWRAPREKHHHGDRLQPAGHGHHGGGCPSARLVSPTAPGRVAGPAGEVASELGHCPSSCSLLPTAPFFKGKNC